VERGSTRFGSFLAASKTASSFSAGGFRVFVDEDMTFDDGYDVICAPDAPR